MEWTNKKGEIMKISYSQELQQKQLQATEDQLIVTRLLLCGIIILVVLLIIGGLYAYELVQRIDALDPLARLVLQ